MKIISALLIVSLVVANTAIAAEYDAECLNHKGKFSSCKVSTEDGRLRISHKDKKNQDLNLDIPGENIKSLTAGEYARRRVGESVAAGAIVAPVLLFMLFSKKKRDQIGVEYVVDLKDKSGPARATMFQIKKKYGLALKTELKALSGKEIEEQETNNKK